MANVRIAFEILEMYHTAPMGYTKLSLQMIFDLNLNIGHMTNTPTELTYSSVLSRYSIRICFLIAALNEVDIQIYRGRKYIFECTY